MKEDSGPESSGHFSEITHVISQSNNIKSFFDQIVNVIKPYQTSIAFPTDTRKSCCALQSLT